VTKFAKICSFAFVAVLFLASAVFAQDGSAPAPLISFSGSFGVGLTAIAAAYGISKLASAALDGMARQPEVAGSLQTAMIIAAALIEGFTFYAIFVCSTGV
jgi:F-type H+-transporting ATPase subunit c